MEKLDLINIGEMYEGLAKEFNSRSKDPDLSLTSLPTLNDKMWGVRKRKLTVIGARTSQGKSSLAVQVCYDLAIQNKSIVFLSLEMENMECAERLFSYAQEINNRALLNNGHKYSQKAIDFGNFMKTKKFIISDCIGRTWEEINHIIEIWHKNKTVPDVIVVDYIQNIKGSGNSAKESYDEYIRKFREMAIRYNFAGILCSQINRTSQETKDKSPQLHQLKGTGFLEEHADIILLLHWPYFYERENSDKNHFELFLAKNKLGETGRFNLRYYPEYSMFKEIESKPRLAYVPPEQKWVD